MRPIFLLSIACFVLISETLLYPSQLCQDKYLGGTWGGSSLSPGLLVEMYRIIQRKQIDLGEFLNIRDDLNADTGTLFQKTV
jgi:hypothetical protein